MKKYLFLFIIFTSFSVFGQKEITLDRAVMGQWQEFYPETVFDFNWLESGKKYAYVKMFRTIVKGEVGKEESVVANTLEVNNALETQIFHFLGVKWRSEKEFVLQQGTTLLTYNIETKTGTAIQLPEDGDNFTFDKKLENIAYTIDNNLFYTPVNEFKQIAVTEFEDGNIVSGQSIARQEMGIDGGIFWSPDGTKLGFYQKDESKVHDYPLLDISTTPGVLKSIKYPMAGQASEKARFGIYDLKSKTIDYIEAKNGEDYYLTNVTWTPDSKYILLAEVARSQKHIWLQRYTAKAVFEKTLFEETADTWVEPEKPAYFPSSTSNDFVWVSERDGFDNLYYYSFDGKLLKQLTTNKFMLKEVVAAQNGEVFFTATGENPLNTLLYKVTTKGKQSLITKEMGTHSAQISAKGDYVFDQYSSSTVPNRALILRGNGKVITELVSASNPLEGYTIPSTEISTLKSEDGQDLYTRIIKPSDFDTSKKYPVLIYVYGGPHAQLITNSWLDGSSLWMYWMAEQGYIVYTLDNRGSGNRGVEFEHVIHRELGVAAYEDQMVGVDYLKSLPYVDESRIAVHGWSFGGFMTMYMMMNSPDLFTTGVAGGPVTDWKFYEVMYGERYMDTPEENPDGYEKTSLLNKADKLKGDLLMIHGSIDPVVVPQHSISMLDEFVKAGIHSDFYLYPMHEHNVLGKDRVHLMEKVLRYVMEKNE